MFYTVSVKSLSKLIELLESSYLLSASYKGCKFSEYKTVSNLK
jgi:hypothetical protein